MKISLKYLVGLVLVLPFLGGCGKSNFSEQKIVYTPTEYKALQVEQGLSVQIQKLSQKESRRYLKRRRNAVVPVRLTFENIGTQDYEFNPRDINLPLADFKTVARSLTPSGKGAYLSFAAVGPVSLGACMAGSAIRECFPASAKYCGGGMANVGSGLMILGGVLIVGTVVGIVGSIVYACVKHRKDKRFRAQEACNYLKPISIPEGKTTSVVLFLKKNSVLPENIQLTIRSSDENKDEVSFVLKPLAI